MKSLKPLLALSSILMFLAGSCAIAQADEISTYHDAPARAPASAPAVTGHVQHCAVDARGNLARCSVTVATVGQPRFAYSAGGRISR